MDHNDADANRNEQTTAYPQVPLRYAGGTLGLGDGEYPWIHFVDDANQRYLTHSVEWILQNIHCFLDGRDHTQLLAGAALHYGLDAYALMGRRGYQDYLAYCIRCKPLPMAALRYGLDTSPLTGRRDY